MGDEYPKVKLAAVQAAPVFLDREATVDKACRLIAEAGGNGAGIIGFPECFIPAFPHWFQFLCSEDPECKRFYLELFNNAVVIPSPATDRLCEAARQAGAYVVMGLNEKEAGSLGTLYNTQLFIGRDGKILGKHRKIVPTKYERIVHGAGDGSTMQVWPTEYGGLGGLICGENTNSLARFTLIARGERFHVASWPAFATRQTQFNHETLDLRARYHAYEAKCFVISATGIFSEEMKALLCKTPEAQANVAGDGAHSSIIGPKGQFLAGPLLKGEGIVYADADVADIVEAKTQHDITGHYNRFDIFRLYVNEEALVPLHLGRPPD
jgi:nitrilase